MLMDMEGVTFQGGCIFKIHFWRRLRQQYFLRLGRNGHRVIDRFPDRSKQISRRERFLDESVFLGEEAVMGQGVVSISRHEKRSAFQAPQFELLRQIPTRHSRNEQIREK